MKLGGMAVAEQDVPEDGSASFLEELPLRLRRQAVAKTPN